MLTVEQAKNRIEKNPTHMATYTAMKAKGIITAGTPWDIALEIIEAIGRWFGTLNEAMCILISLHPAGEIVIPVMVNDECQLEYSIKKRS